MAIIEIEDLPSTGLPNMLHEFAAQKDGLTVKLRVDQVYSLILAAMQTGAPSNMNTFDEISASLGDDPAFAATMTSALALKAALTQVARTDVSQSLSSAQKIQLHSNIARANLRNLIVNAQMAVAQESGGGSSGTAGWHAVDQWFSSFSTSAGVVSFGRVGSKTPRGSAYRVRLSVTTADTSLAAGEYLCLTQKLEGSRLADLGWNGTTGQQLVLRFGFRGPAGTYSISYQNPVTATRTWVSNFTISAGQANTDVEITKVIPACTTGGTWPNDNGQGSQLNITLASGSTFNTTPDVWATGNFLGGTGISNGLGANTNVFELFDVGLYADPASTGVAPEWVPQDYYEALRDCERYWFLMAGVIIQPPSAPNSSVFFPTYMRASPTATNPTGNPGFVLNQSTPLNADISCTTRAYANVAFNARM